MKNNVLLIGRNLLLIWLCIAQPTVAIASEVSWAGSFNTDNASMDLDWRGQLQDLSSGVRLQSRQMLSENVDVVLESTVSWRDTVKVDDYRLGIASPMGQVRYGKLPSLLNQPTHFQPKTESKATLSPLRTFFSQHGDVLNQATQYDSPTLMGFNVSLIHAKGNPSNPDFSHIEKVETPEEKSFVSKKDTFYRKNDVQGLMMQYAPHPNLFVRYTREKHQQHVPVLLQEELLTTEIGEVTDIKTTVNAQRVTGFIPGSINRFEAGWQAADFALIVGLQGAHLGGLPFAPGSEQYAPFNQSFHQSQQMGISAAWRPYPKLTARIGYTEGKSHWVNGVALSVASNNSLYRQAAPWAPANDSETDILSHRTADYSAFVCATEDCRQFITLDHASTIVASHLSTIQLKAGSMDYSLERTQNFSEKTNKDAGEAISQHHIAMNSQTSQDDKKDAIKKADEQARATLNEAHETFDWYNSAHRHLEAIQAAQLQIESIAKQVKKALNVEENKTPSPPLTPYQEEVLNYLAQSIDYANEQLTKATVKDNAAKILFDASVGFTRQVSCYITSYIDSCTSKAKSIGIEPLCTTPSQLPPMQAAGTTKLADSGIPGTQTSNTAMATMEKPAAKTITDSALILPYTGSKPKGPTSNPKQKPSTAKSAKEDAKKKWGRSKEADTQADNAEKKAYTKDDEADRKEWAVKNVDYGDTATLNDLEVQVKEAQAEYDANPTPQNQKSLDNAKNRLKKQEDFLTSIEHATTKNSLKKAADNAREEADEKIKVANGKRTDADEATTEAIESEETYVTLYAEENGGAKPSEGSVPPADQVTSTTTYDQDDYNAPKPEYSQQYVEEQAVQHAQHSPTTNNPAPETTSTEVTPTTESSGTGNESPPDSTTPNEAAADSGEGTPADGTPTTDGGTPPSAEPAPPDPSLPSQAGGGPKSKPDDTVDQTGDTVSQQPEEITDSTISPKKPDPPKKRKKGKKVKRFGESRDNETDDVTHQDFDPEAFAQIFKSNLQADRFRDRKIERDATFTTDTPPPRLSGNSRQDPDTIGQDPEREAPGKTKPTSTSQQRQAADSSQQSLDASPSPADRLRKQPVAAS